MKFRTQACAAVAVLALVSLPGIVSAFDDCPADHVSDGYTCTEKTAAGKTGGYFRVTVPSDWDGDLVIANHGFDLNDKHTRPHESCSNNSTMHCEQDSDCGASPAFCNNISYMGLDALLLPRGKAIAAGTYTDSGWATFHSAKDLQDIIKFVKKDVDWGSQLKRVIITGFSGGGAVTADATLKLKIDGAVPLCAAAAGGLTTWDVAQEVRLVYDYLCDGVPGAKFGSAPDEGEKNSADSGGDSIAMAVKVDRCFGVIGIDPQPGYADRLAKFLELTQFTGDLTHGGSDFNVAVAMGFATLGLGDFVRDPNRLNGKKIGLNDTIDYTGLGANPTLAADYDANVKRLTFGVGRKILRKASWPDFTKGKGKKVAYPILSMAGANDWLVIPEFQRVYTTALTTGGKAFTQTWIDSYGHCVFTEQEITALFTEYFDWLGPVGGPNGPQPSPADIEAACLALPGGVNGDTCNFNNAFSPGAIYDRIPQREDWPAAAKQP